MILTFERAIAVLEDRLGRPLPGSEAQARMAPLRSDAVERTQVAGRDCREAAVLALLEAREDAPHLIVTVRRGHLADHAGQVSFPGGRREDGEPLLQTALRETQEEIDLLPDEVSIIGELTPLYIPPSNYCVYPFVGYTRSNEMLTPHDVEVERIVYVPLANLLDPAAIREEDWTIRGETLRVPFFDVAGLQIWGATAMMLSELVEILRGAS